MAAETGALGPTIIGGYQSLHLEVVRLKYVLLKVAESYKLPGEKKIAFRDRVISAGNELGAHFQGLADRKLTRYNIDEFAESEGAYVKALSADLRKLQASGLKLLHAKVNLKRTLIRETDVDGQLLASRIFDQETIGRDKLERLNAARRLLPETDEKKPAGPSVVDQELKQLKLRSYVEGLAGWSAVNPDILFKVRSRLEAALTARVPAFVTMERLQRGDLPNRGDLYACITDDGSCGLHYCEAAVCMHLVVEPLQTKGDSTWFLGRISGWAEAGASRTEFSAAHPRSGSRVTGGEAGALARQLLETTGTRAIYEAVASRHREWKRRDIESVEREVKSAKEKVIKALDALEQPPTRG